MAHRSLGPLPDVANMLHVQYFGTVNAVNWMCSFFTKYSGSPPNNAQLRTFNTAIHGVFATNLCPLMATTSQLSGVKTTDLSSRTAAWDQYSATALGTRPIGSGGLANNVALCISKVVLRRYRGGHPRFYLPPPALTDVTGGRTWAGAFLTTAQNAADAFLTAFNAVQVGGVVTVMHNVGYYTHDSAGLPIYKPQPSQDPVTKLNVRTRIDSQRRRTGKETV